VETTSELDFVNLVTALHRVARECSTKRQWGLGKDPRLKQLLFSVRQSLDDPGPKKPRHLSNTVWALSQLQIEDAPLLESIAQAALATIEQFEPHSLASTAWAVAKLKWEHAPLWEGIVGQTLQQIDEFDTRGISNTAWSCATLR